MIEGERPQTGFSPGSVSPSEELKRWLSFYSKSGDRYVDLVRERLAQLQHGQYGVRDYMDDVMTTWRFGVEWWTDAFKMLQPAEMQSANAVVSILQTPTPGARCSTTDLLPLTTIAPIGTSLFHMQHGDDHHQHLEAIKVPGGVAVTLIDLLDLPMGHYAGMIYEEQPGNRKPLAVLHVFKNWGDSSAQED